MSYETQQYFPGLTQPCILKKAGRVRRAHHLRQKIGSATVDSGSTVKNNLRFPGQYYDAERGLHYNWFRYYDPSTGRYVTADPIGLWGGINLYRYSLNNPINLKDPYGLIPPALIPLVNLGLALAPYSPVIIDFGRGFVEPTAPPPTPFGYGGMLARAMHDDIIKYIDLNAIQESTEKLASEMIEAYHKRHINPNWAYDYNDPYFKHRYKRGEYYYESSNQKCETD